MGDIETGAAEVKPESVQPDFESQRHQPDTKFNRPRRGGGGGGRGRGRGGRGGFNPKFRNNDEKRNFQRGGPFKNELDAGPSEETIDGGREYRFNDRIYDKLASIAGPAHDLPPIETTEKKFSGRCRLYIGNLSNETTEDELREVLTKFGEISDLFINKERNFAFVKYDYQSNAERAKHELDSEEMHGKSLKIRSAPSNFTIKVKNLSEFTSNELLHYAFSVFGEIERAIVIVDEKGKATDEGLVEFTRKGPAMNAIKFCTERCFFLTETLRPVIVEPYEYINETDGIAERCLPKRNPNFLKSRSKGPRLAELNSFEHDYGLRWKQLLDLYAQKEEALKKELQMEKEKLEAQMEYARYEHETELLREQLRARELDRERQKQEWEAKERLADEQRRRTEEQIRRQQESLQARMQQQEEEMRRRQQENNLLMQAQELHSMLDEQEQNYENQETSKFEPPQFENRFNERQDYNRERWVNEGRNDFPNKRRRFFKH